MGTKVRHSAKTDVGLTRDHNEDCFGFGPEDAAEAKGYLAIVCDGMGGHAAGEVASSLAVETIIAHYYRSDDPDRAHVLEESFLAANQRVYDEGRGSMGTTGVSALLYEEALYVANIGDSRAYLLRDGQLRQLTQDHSFVAEQVAAGLLTPEQARHSIHKNVITRAIGYQPEVAVDITRWHVRPGDLILLSSDGLHGLVDDDEIATIAAQDDLDQSVEQLVALANRRGGSDNITVAAVQVDALDLAQSAAPEGKDTAPLSDDDLPPTQSFAVAGVVGRTPPSHLELPLRLWGALLASITALALLGLGLWVVLDDRLDPLAQPTIPSLPVVSPAASAAPTAPLPQQTATLAPSTTPLRPTPTP